MQLLRINIIIHSILVLSLSCILDPFHTAIDKEDSNKVTKAEAKDKIITAAAIKISLCGQVSEKGILSRVFLSISGSRCDDNPYSIISNKSKNLQSCENQYNFVSKSNLDSCVNEILLSPCETTSDVNIVFSVGYHACSSMLNTEGKISFY
ncbi:hypothetical protein [Leptospira ellisii]|uniref:hypothetical protein n=1 Tax=Leptospira ellisii TaxID=2023197 RepID=UPI000C2B3966|nr:hypothetical protein [Leptospira ellisii]PKA02636.1 hypothetical protein CH375_21790 [Leptospira ellisii]